MFTIGQKVLGYISGTVVNSELKAGKCERPTLEDFISVSGFEREKFEGVISTITERDIVINDDIYYNIPYSQLKGKFNVGDAVQGIAERKTKHEAWRALSLSPGLSDVSWDAEQPKLTGKPIPCKDLDAGIPGILKNDLFPTDGSKRKPLNKSSSEDKLPDEAKTTFRTTIVGKVKEIIAGDVKVNEDVYFRLSAVEISFDLYVGDWIVCKVTELNPPRNSNPEDGSIPKEFVNVTHVEPLRKKKIKGEVTRVYPRHFVINNEVYCSRELTKGLQLPRVGNSVIVEVIESDQDHLWWRAISASPPTVKNLGVGITPKLNGLPGDIKTSQLLDDKYGISISHSLRFPQVFLGSQSHLTVFITNNGEEGCSLFRVYFITASQESQFSVLSESSNGPINDAPVPLMPSKGLYIKLECVGKLLGHCRQLCIFDFGDFHIGRYVTAIIEEKQLNCLAPTSPYHPLSLVARRSIFIQPKDSRVIKGEKPFRAPAFLPVSLPQYPVPVQLWEAGDSMENILEIAPFLREPGTPENYQDRYSALLHLEEIEMTHQIRQFDMTRAMFKRHGPEYLSLAVPGLAEKRPSLMIGDTVIASHPGNIGGTEYEGYIHEVLHTQVLLKFHPSFHNQYRDEDYAVRFNFNRTPLRRCHFALKFSVQQLGAGVLFPTKLKFQLPQVCYVDPEMSLLNASRRAGQSGPNVCREISHTDKQEGNFETAQETFKLVKETRCSVKGTKLVKENAEMHAVQSGRPLKLMEGSAGDTVKYNERVISESGIGDERCLVAKRDADTTRDENGSERNCNKIERKEQHERAADHGIEFSQDHNLDDARLKGCDIKCSPCSTRVISKRPNITTPPRVPVVTRLFGVPSPGSSSNSSICCSDDESKTNREIETETKVSSNIHDKKVLSENRDKLGVRSMQNNSIGGLVEAGSHSATLRSAHPTFEKYSSLKIDDKNVCKSSYGKVYQENKWETQNKNQTESLQIKPLGSEKCGANVTKSSLGYPAETSSVNPNPVFNGSMGKNIQGIDSENCNELFRRNLPPYIGIEGNYITSSVVQVKNPQHKYCVPVLPLKSSGDKKVKGKQIPLLTWFNKILNLEQKMAVRRILEGSTRPLPYVIYGPPGTGKTITVVEAILQIFTLVHHSRLLIVTPSNSAADLVTERLLTFDVLKTADLIRLNAFQRKEESIPDSIRSYCCNGDEMSVRVRQRVIITTATTAGLMYTLGLHNGHFTHIFVDEAGQLTEPECLVALGLVNSVSGQIVLAGDPRQLGPVVQSRRAKGLGLQESLLHRLCNSMLYQPEERNDFSSWIYEPRLLTQLVRNYRSHPDVINVPSKLFYHDSLIACADLKIQEKLLRWDKLPNSSCPLLFHGLVSENLQEGDSPSWFNPTEAFQVVRYAQNLIRDFGMEPANIGIITPYRKQVQKIRQLLTTFGIENGIKVGTVEEFQGQERVVIIISTVRSSEQLLEVDVQHSLGFVKCRRRFNVSITRAQSLLIVVGNPLLLMLDDCWHTFINFCIDKKAYIGPELQFDE